ncbi:MAG: Fe-S cluster assembly protein HesB [Bacteroidota bacterium]
MSSAERTKHSQKLLEIDRILCRFYGAPFPYFSTKDAVSQLVSTILSQRTRNATTKRAYENLIAHFPTWEAVMTAPTEKIQVAIASVTYPEVKAERIQNALKLIKDANFGQLSLDFLKEMKPINARKWLEKIPGVGAKTSAAVLNFSELRIPALVVDTHHQRVMQRTGIVPPKASIAKIAYKLQEMLPSDWTARQVYDHHEALMYHGQKCCHFLHPECSRCPIEELCEFGKEG